MPTTWAVSFCANTSAFVPRSSTDPVGWRGVDERGLGPARAVPGLLPLHERRPGYGVGGVGGAGSVGIALPSAPGVGVPSGNSVIIPSVSAPAFFAPSSAAISLA